MSDLNLSRAQIKKIVAKVATTGSGKDQQVQNYSENSPEHIGYSGEMPRKIMPRWF